MGKGEEIIAATTRSPERNTVVDTLFERDDYRAFLRDVFAQEKLLRPRFSLRALAAKVGFRSSGYWTLVLSGQRNLGEESIERVCAALGLVGEPARFFGILVRHNQARSVEERLRTLDALKESRKTRAFARIASHQFPYWEEWHHVAVRELVVHAPWDGDFEVLGRLLRPSISAEQARASVERLESLGLVRRRGDGLWEQVDPIVTADGAPPVLLREFKKEMVLRGLDALEGLAPAKRHFSTVTLAMRSDSVREFARRIDELRADMLRAAAEETPEVVVQANFQVFPLSEAFPPPRTADGQGLSVEM